MHSGWGYWLAGFVDGEGSFTISRQHKGTHAYMCRFSIGLRRDDLHILEEMRCELGGIGNIYYANPRSSPNAKPQAHWNVDSRNDVGVIRDFFRRYPLRAKKRWDFYVWAQAVDLWLAKPSGTQRGPGYAAEMVRLQERLGSLRVFWDPAGLEPHVLDRHLAAVAS